MALFHEVSRIEVDVDCAIYFGFVLRCELVYHEEEGGGVVLLMRIVHPFLLSSIRVDGSDGCVYESHEVEALSHSSEPGQIQRFPHRLLKRRLCLLKHLALIKV